MKSIVIEAAGEMAVTHDRPMPELKPNEVLVKIEYVGFCGSDLNTFRGLNPMVKLPVIPGHEIGGTIASIGSDVPEGLFTEGMHVTVNPYTNCGKCSSCRNGRVNACRNNATLGVQRNGAMCEYIAMPWEKIIPAPGISTRDCALIEPMSVGFHAVDRAQVSDNDTVMVIGCGMIGMGAIVRASLRGATVIAVDLDDEKLDVATAMGAAYTINTSKDDAHTLIQEITDGDGPSVVIEAVGAPATYIQAFDEVAFAGRVVCIGYAKKEVPLRTQLFVQKELNIYGSRNALPADFRAVIRYMSTGKCPVERLISMIVEPDTALNAMKTWVADPGKVFRILVKF